MIPRRHGADGLEAAPAGVERRGGAAEAAAGAAQCPGRIDQRLGWFAQRKRGLNSGEAAGQAVFHAHWHLIPRRVGDCEEPRGGVRGVIAEHRSY